MKTLYILGILVTVYTNSFAEKIRLGDLTVNQEEYSHIDYTYDKKILIGKGLPYSAKMEITDRGNGWLKIANLDLHVGRSGYDSLIYKNGLLDVDFVDINGDGFKDIVISGLVLYPHEQREIILYRESVLFIYSFDPKGKIFNLGYMNSSFRLEPDIKDDRKFYGELYVVEKYVKEGHRMAFETNRKKPDGTTRECIRISGDCFERFDGPGKYNNIIEIGHGIKLPVRMERDKRGRDAWLSTGNLKLNVYGDYFNIKTTFGTILDVDFIDINNDGYKDIIISGMVSYTKSAHEDIVLPSEHAIFIYTFDPDKKEFRCAYRNASFRLEESAVEHVRTRVADVRAAIGKMNKSLDEKRIELSVPDIK